MPYTIVLQPRAARQIDKLTPDVQRRILSALEKLKSEPRPMGYKKLKGQDELYRVRVMDYRIIYEIEDDRLCVLVVQVGHRSDIYG